MNLRSIINAGITDLTLHLACRSWRSAGTSAFSKARGFGHTHKLSCRESSSRASIRNDRQYIVGIESSCDDTGIAVLRASDGKVLGHSITSQVDIHAPWGGVVPNLAMEAHRDAMEGTLADALCQAQLRSDQLDAVAVTIGPGLSLCLKVGVLKAIQLAHEHRLKYIPVHHMEAHALIARQSHAVGFPFLCLLVSGGHNMLLVAHNVGNYTLLGSTLDDAVGEAFDKAARFLGLELRPNGGAALERFALEGDPDSFKFSVPLKKYKDCNFSYAGLKTAVRLAIEAKLPEGPTEDNRQVRANIAASFQRVAVTHLVDRVVNGIDWVSEDFPEVRDFVVAGGVAANRLVRSELEAAAAAAGLGFVCPPVGLCTDNGVMIAWAGIERMRAGWAEQVPELPGVGDEFSVDVRPRWPLTDRLHRKTMTQSRSQKKSRLFPSLTELTLQSQAAAA